VRAVCQRVREARVEVEGEVVGSIEGGLLVFLGAGEGDTEDDLAWTLRKVVELRVFEDERGKLARSVVDVGGGLLVVSQFTLFGDVRRGNRPSFTGAMAPDPARAMVAAFVARARERVARVETGRFGADMRVVADNAGPITILLDSRDR
jgi:D-tyrosyl-tRNA(Tyr) deacylase